MESHLPRRNSPHAGANPRENSSLKGRGGSLPLNNITYNKNYQADSIRISHKQVGKHGYLFLLFNYGYLGSQYDVEHEIYIEHYRPFQCTTGIALERKYWTKDGLSEDFRKDHGSRLYAEILGKLESLKNKVFQAYEGLTKDLGKKPSPEQLRDRLNGKSDKASTRMPLALYIDSLAQSKKVRDRKTKLKYRTLATYIRALEACREHNSEFQSMCEGTRGVVTVSSFNLQDWNDLQLLVQETGTEIPQTFRKAKSARSFAFDGEGYYSEATLHKLQSNLLAVLRRAKKDPALGARIDIDTREKISAQSTRKVSLNPEELGTVLERDFTFTSGHLVNARKLMILQLFSGVRVSDLSKILDNPIREVRGRRTTFQAIYLSTKKTGEAICLPLLQPMLDVLLSGHKPHMIAVTNLNNYYKEVACDLGLTRIIHRVERKANAVRVDHQDELHSVFRSHDCRRSFFGLLTGYLYVSRLLATQVTGHRLSRAQGEDEGYFNLSPEHKAESLLAQIYLAEENLPFDVVPKDFVRQWESSKSQGRRIQSGLGWLR